MCGDPPNIIIGTSLGYTFGEFISNTGFIALISLVVIVIYFYLCFHKELAGQGAVVQITSYPDPKEAITDKGEFAKELCHFPAGSCPFGNPCADGADRCVYRYVYCDFDTCDTV